jgi:hypothetical protein
MSDQPRDDEGKFAKASGSQVMDRLIRERTGRGRVRIVPELCPGHRVMNELMLRATGRMPEDDEPAAA